MLRYVLNILHDILYLVYIKYNTFMEISFIRSTKEPCYCLACTGIEPWNGTKCLSFACALYFYGIHSMSTCIMWNNENVYIQSKFHWRLFISVQQIIFQHCFRWWLGLGQVISHYLNQWWLIYWCIYVSLGINELSQWYLVNIMMIGIFPYWF